MKGIDLPTLSQPAVTFNGHSMVGPLQRVLVCSPRTAGWNLPHRVAAWRDLGFHHAPDFEKAQSQHETLLPRAHRCRRGKDPWNSSPSE